MDPLQSDQVGVALVLEASWDDFEVGEEVVWSLEGVVASDVFLVVGDAFCCCVFRTVLH